MQWRALICGCSIRTSHKGALPMTVLLSIMSVSTAAPDSALRCSMTVGGRTRSRRLMVDRGRRVSAALPVAGWRAGSRRNFEERQISRDVDAAIESQPFLQSKPDTFASVRFLSPLALLADAWNTRNMNAIAGALDQGSEAEKQGAPLSPAAVHPPATLTAAVPASSQRCCRSSRRCS